MIVSRPSLSEQHSMIWLIRRPTSVSVTIGSLFLPSRLDTPFSPTTPSVFLGVYVESGLFQNRPMTAQKFVYKG